MKKILFLVTEPLEMNTSASIRNRAMIKGFIENNCLVDVVTGELDTNHKNYEGKFSHKNLNIYYLNQNIHKAIKFSRRFKLLKPFKRKLYYLLQKSEIYDKYITLSKSKQLNKIIINKYDAIISSSDPKSSHLLAENIYLNRIKNIPWIQIWGDPFYDDITRINHKLDQKIYKEEKRLLSLATHIIYVSPITLEKQKYLFKESAHKMSATPIPFEKKCFYDVNNNKNQRELTLLYTGDYNARTRNILPLIDAVKKTNHKLIICGESDLSIKSHERLIIMGRKKKKDIIELEEQADVLIHISNLKGTQIPGKIYQYSGTNKPILFILDGDHEKIRQQFCKYNRYDFCMNNTQSIQEILADYKINTLKNQPVKEFEPSVIANNILERI